MATDGEGGYEFVLGNRLLLSGFFIVVILLAVFFTMGYIVGRNSAPSVSAASSPASSLPTRTEAAGLPVAPPAREPAPAPPESGAREPGTHPAAAPAAGASTDPPAVEFEAGPGRMFLQVMAVRQPQAGAVVDTLKKSGFAALLGDSPDGVKFRVLVGPFADSAALGKAKADLENAGFHPLVRK